MGIIALGAVGRQLLHTPGREESHRIRACPDQQASVSAMTYSLDGSVEQTASNAGSLECGSDIQAVQKQTSCAAWSIGSARQFSCGNSDDCALCIFSPDER